MEINIKRDGRGRKKPPPKAIFEQNIKTDKPLNRLIKKREKTQITTGIREVSPLHILQIFKDTRTL